jgi:hypothetical protein
MDPPRIERGSPELLACRLSDSVKISHRVQVKYLNHWTMGPMITLNSRQFLNFLQRIMYVEAMILNY